MNANIIGLLIKKQHSYVQLVHIYVKLAIMDKKNSFVTVEIDGATYAFPENPAGNYITGGEQYYLNKVISNSLPKRTSLRLDSFVSWQLELIARTSKIINIEKHKTYNDIIGNLINLSYSDNNSEIRYKLTKQIKNQRNILTKGFYMSDEHKKTIGLAELTYNSGYIMRTLNLAIFESDLLSDFENKLIRTLVTNKRFCNSPFEAIFPENKREQSEYFKKMIIHMKENIQFDFYAIFVHFGSGSAETQIQAQTTLTLANPESTNGIGYEDHMDAAENYPHKFDADKILEESGEDEYHQYKLDLAKHEMEQTLHHFRDDFEGQYRTLLNISKKLGVFQRTLSI